jgi:hypothetical protein
VRVTDWKKNVKLIVVVTLGATFLLRWAGRRADSESRAITALAALRNEE